jgi:hypothetical protein
VNKQVWSNVGCAAQATRKEKGKTETGVKKEKSGDKRQGLIGSTNENNQQTTAEQLTDTND